MYFYAQKTFAVGCNDGKGRCYKVGENVSGECFDAVCQLSENKTVVSLEVTKGGNLSTNRPVCITGGC